MFGNEILFTRAHAGMGTLAQQWFQIKTNNFLGALVIHDSEHNMFNANF